MLVSPSRAHTRVEVEHVQVEAAAQRRRLRGKPQVMRPYARWAFILFTAGSGGAPAQA